MGIRLPRALGVLWLWGLSCPGPHADARDPAPQDPEPAPPAESGPAPEPDKGPEPPPTAGEPTPAELQARGFDRLAELVVRKPPASQIDPELLPKVARDSAILHIDRKTRRLELRVSDGVALSCPVACGRLARPTPAGKFAIARKDDNPPKISDYGSLIDSRGNLLLTGVYSKLDPVPLGATFVVAPPSVSFELDNGTLIHSGDANGTASTDGSVVIPTTVARTLFARVGPGFRVVIE